MCFATRGEDSNAVATLLAYARIDAYDLSTAATLRAHARAHAHTLTH